MAVINTGLTQAGLKSEFFAEYNATEKHYKKLATEIKSNRDKETYKFLGTVPQMREWGNGRLAKGLRSESYDIKNLKYESTIEVDRDEYDDDQTGQLGVRVRELGERAGTHPDYLMSYIINNGHVDGFNAYDGVPFFSEAHESGASGAQSNLLESGAVAGDNPTTQEFRASLAKAIQAMLGLKDDQGEPMMVSVKGLVCVVPASMYFTASEAISASLVENTNNALQNVARIIGFPRLTAPNKWFLFNTSGAVRPFVFQNRAPVEFQSLMEDSEENFKREKFLFGVRARYGFTYGYWQKAVSVEFTD